MKSKSVQIEEIKPYWRNPRKTDAAVAPVAESIKRYGFNQPIVVDEDYVVIAGHTRLRAARTLGLESVPVIVASLSKDEARAFRLADNATAEISRWDFEKLSDEMQDLDGERFGPYFSESELSMLKPSNDEVEMTAPKESDRVDRGAGDDRITCPKCFADFAMEKPNE